MRTDTILLQEFKSVLVATVYLDRVEVDTTLEDRLWGSEFYPEVKDGIYYMVDMQEDKVVVRLGFSLEEALNHLDKYEDIFNNYSTGFYESPDEGWATIFTYSILTESEREHSINEYKELLS